MATRSLSILTLLMRIAVAAVFLSAGTLKIFGSQQFAIDVHNYRLLPWSLSVAVALYLPWLEIVCGLSVLLKLFYRGALLLLFALTLVFGAAISSAWMRGIDIACGCFGAAFGEANLAQALMRDFALAIAIAFLGLCEFQKTRNAGNEESSIQRMQAPLPPR